MENFIIYRIIRNFATAKSPNRVCYIENMNTRKIIQALTFLASKQPDHTLDNMRAYKLLFKTA